MKLPKKNLSLVHVACLMGVRIPSPKLSACCTSPLINKWAKYKPVDNDFTEPRPSDWWRAKDNSCGIYFNTYNTLDDMAQAVYDGLIINNFTYKGPKGNLSSPYRLGDFAGYDSKAKPPMSYGPVPEEVNIARPSMIFMTPVMVGTEDQLGVGDVFGRFFQEEVRFGVGIKRVGNRYWKWLTSVEAFTEGNNTVNLEYPIAGQFNAGTYEVIQFLTHDNSRKSGIQLPISDRLCYDCMPLPPWDEVDFQPIQEMVIKEKSDVDAPVDYEIHLVAQFNKKYEPSTDTFEEDRSQVSYRISFRSKDGKSRVLRNIELRLVKDMDKYSELYEKVKWDRIDIGPDGTSDVKIGFLHNKRIGTGTIDDMWNPDPITQVWEDTYLRLRRGVMQQLNPQE